MSNAMAHPEAAKSTSKPAVPNWSGLWRSALCLVWAAAFLMMWFGEWGEILMAPWQRVVLGIAGLVMIAVALIRLPSRSSCASTPSLIEGMIHCLPLALLLTVEPQHLGSEFVDRIGWNTPLMSSGVGPMTPADREPTIIELLEEGEPPPSLPPSGPLAEDGVTIYDCYQAGYAWNGRQVEVLVSLAELRPDRKANLPPQLVSRGVTALGFRLLVSCCAADARPVTVALVGTIPEGSRENDWLLVRGRMEVVDVGQPIVVIHASEIRRSRRPKTPYLSPFGGAKKTHP